MKSRILLAALLLTSLAHATVTINATLVGANGNPVPYAFLTVDLEDCGYNIPQVPGGLTSIVLKHQQYTVSQLPATIYGNNEITCGNSYSTLWHITAWADSNTKLAGDYDYALCSSLANCAGSNVTAAWNLAQSQPFVGTLPPPGYRAVFGNPIANQVITQPNNTSLAIIGVLDLSRATVQGLSAVGINALQIQGLSVSATGNQDGYQLTWNAAQNAIIWAPGSSNASAAQLQGQNICSTVPLAGQVLTFSTQWCPQVISGFLPSSGGTLTGPLTLSANALTNLQPVTLQQMTGALQAYAPLVNGLVLPANLGSGAATSSTCLLGNSTWGPCGSSGGGNIANGAQFLLPRYTSPGTTNFVGPSNYFDNGSTIGAYSGTQYQSPEGSNSQPGMAIAVSGSLGTPPSFISGLGMYLAPVQAQWSVNAASTSGGTATLTLSNTNGWPFTYISGEYFVTNGVGGGYDCALPNPCQILVANGSAGTITYTSAGTGNLTPVGATWQMVTLGFSKYAHKVLFNSLQSTSNGAAQSGSIQFGPGDGIEAHDPTNNADVILLVKNNDASTADVRAAQVGDNT